MAFVTVRDLLRLTPPERLRLIAGHTGLDQEVKWVTSLRATPPYLSHLNGGELVLLMTNTLRSVSMTQLITALAERGATAAITDHLSTDAINAAEARGLPLLLVDQTASSDLENELNRLLNERLNYLYSVSSGAGRRFAELAVSGGVAAILEHAASLVEKTVLWEDEGFVMLMAVPPPGQLLAFPAPQPPAAFRPEWRRPGGVGHESVVPVATSAGADGYRRLLAPVMTNGIVRGYLSAVAQQEEFTDVDRTVIQRAAEACAFELLRSPVSRREESPAIEALLVELLEGRFGSDSALLGRARYLGLAIERPHLVAAIDPGVAGQRDVRTRQDAARQVGLEMRGRLGEALLVRGLEPAIVVLAPLAEPLAAERERVRRALSDIVRRVNQRLDEEKALGIGLGDVYQGLEGYGRSYQEALYALRVGATLELEPPVDFATMGFYRLLFPLHGHEELVHFRDDVLGALLQYDQRRHSEMIETLEAYFASGCNVVEAADRLHVHRNSLAYRLRRVAEITGRDLHHQEHLFLLQLGLKIHRVLQAMEAEPAGTA